MAQTGLADIIKPQILGKQLAGEFPRMLALANSGAVYTDPSPLIANGGTQLTIPRWKVIGKLANFTGAAISLGKIQQVPEYGIVARRAGGQAVEDVAALVSRDDPSAEIRSQLAPRLADSIDDAGVAVLSGAIPAANRTVKGVSSGTKVGLNGSVMAEALTKLGDQAGKLKVIVMHSAVFNDLLAQSLITFVANPQVAGKIYESGDIPYYLGKRVIVSDLCPFDATVADHVLYTSFMLGANAMYLGYQRMVNVETDRDITTKLDIVTYDQHFVMHLIGASFTGTPAAAYGPSDAELATTGNWTMVAESAKSVLAAAIVTNTVTF